LHFSNKTEFLDADNNNAVGFKVDHINPQEVMLFDELNSKITETVNSFSPQCLNVFLLSRFEGKKNREIAEHLGIKLKTVESHMKKALMVLKKSLGDYLK
jgi:RNA polymerase sigma-70 factor (ECF subfamily)